MEKLNVDQICELLIEKGFGEDVAAVFKENKITGELLTQLDDADMKELGLKALGDRKNLRKLVAQYESDSAAGHGSTVSAAIHEEPKAAQGGAKGIAASPVVQGGIGRHITSAAKNQAEVLVRKSKPCTLAYV